MRRRSNVLNRIATAAGGEVITETSQRNKEFYLRKLKEFQSDDPKLHAKDPEGAALCALIESVIRRRDYIIYSYKVDDNGEKLQPIGKYDIICTFNVVGEPSFGFLRDADGDDAMERSTKDGNRLFYL